MERGNNVAINQNVKIEIYDILTLWPCKEWPYICSDLLQPYDNLIPNNMTLLYRIINPQRAKRNNIILHFRITPAKKKGEP